jgi:hypothetical protein
MEISHNFAQIENDNSVKIREIDGRINDLISSLEVVETNENDHFNNEYYSTSNNEEEIASVIFDTDEFINTALRQWMGKFKPQQIQKGQSNDELKILNLEEIHENQEKFRSHLKELRKFSKPEEKKTKELSWIKDFYLNKNKSIKTTVSQSPNKFKKMHVYTHDVYKSHKPKVDENKISERVINMEYLKVKKLTRDKILEIRDKNHVKVINNKLFQPSRSPVRNRYELPEINKRSVDSLKAKTSAIKTKKEVDLFKYGSYSLL